MLIHTTDVDISEIGIHPNLDEPLEAIRMKQYIFLNMIVLFSLLASAGVSLPQTTLSVPSNGIVNNSVINPPSNQWWGAVVSDTAWQPWGYSFKDTQINIMKQSGATAVRIMLDRQAWITNDTSNVLHTSYRDYIKQLVQWAKPELRVLLDLTRDTSWGSSEWEAKTQIITNETLRSGWISWGKEVISHCQPDAIGLMNEPGGGGAMTTFDYYYDNFVIPSINAYRIVDPNIRIYVMGMGFWDLIGFASRPLNDSGVYYEYHIYYDYPVDPNVASPRYYQMSQAYGEGRLAEARDYLWQYLDWKFGSIPKSKIAIAESGVIMLRDETVPSKPNWNYFMKDLYDYAKQKGMLGLYQYAFGRHYYQMLDPSTQYTTLTPYGQLWAQNCPPKV